VLTEPLQDTDLSFLPVVGVVLFGVSITALAVSVLRVKGAWALQKHPPPKASIEKILQQRLLKERCADFNADIRQACEHGVLDKEDLAVPEVLGGHGSLETLRRRRRSQRNSSARSHAAAAAAGADVSPAAGGAGVEMAWQSDDQRAAAAAAGGGSTRRVSITNM
jgi:hypothetical protein